MTNPHPDPDKARADFEAAIRVHVNPPGDGHITEVPAADPPGGIPEPGWHKQGKDAPPGWAKRGDTFVEVQGAS